MTAEIAIMNKEGVALAADSAVTVREEKGEKILTTANKIFTLSKYHPIGIMVYGSATLMGVPWETIIKIYRQQLGKKSFQRLEDYQKDFLDFISNAKTLFPEEQQIRHVEQSCSAYFRKIRKEIERKLEKAFEDDAQIDENQVKMVAAEIINSNYKHWSKCKINSIQPDNYLKDIRTKYKEIFIECIRQVFEELPLSDESKKKLREIASFLFTKFPEGITYSGYSGVVIAGFGEDDYFPSLRQFALEGIVLNHPKYKNEKPIDITFSHTAAIIPFAESIEDVHAFMVGINPAYKSAISDDIGKILEGFKAKVSNYLSEYPKIGEPLVKELSDIESELLSKYVANLSEFERREFIDPVINVVDILPKQDLAAMAESLVNLTSFKKKVSMTPETVGGPIDVAVISKGDGFIWIKRKHYFKTELNPHFFERYTKKEQNYDTEQDNPEESLPLDG